MRFRKALACWSIAVAWIAIPLALSGQSSTPVLKSTACRQWDDAYLSLAETSIGVCAVAAFLLPLAFGLLGRFWWLAAAPRLRILVAAIAVFSLAALAVVGLPMAVGFEWGWVSGIGLRYFDCQTVRFGGAGLFDGLIGAGLAAISQWATILGLQAGASLVGGLLSWVLSALTARFLGLRRLASGEAV